MFHRCRLVVRLLSDPRTEVRRLSEVAVELSNLGKFDGGRQLRQLFQKTSSKVWPPSPRVEGPKVVCFVRNTRVYIHPRTRTNGPLAVNHLKPKHKNTSRLAKGKQREWGQLKPRRRRSAAEGQQGMGVVAAEKKTEGPLSRFAQTWWQ